MSLRPKHVILILGSTPHDVARLAMTTEHAAIDDELRRSDRRDEFDLRPVWELHAARLPGLIMRYRPQILHFCGHGNPEGELVFQRADNTSAPADKDSIARLFEALGGTVRCVVLNSCHSAAQAELIAEHVDVVVGMRGAIQDRDAVSFSAGFYEALGYGHGFAEAFELAKLRLDLDLLASDEQPTLYVREDARRAGLSSRGLKRPRGQARRRTAKVRPTLWLTALACVVTLALVNSTSGRRNPEPDVRPPTPIGCPSGFERTPAGHCISTDDEHERVYVPPGPAYVGCDSSLICKHNESPRRRVEVDGFAIGRTEVSVRQYQRCVDAGRCSPAEDEPISPHGVPSSFRVEGSEELPANYIDWYDARDYCRWAGGDLCTAKEWEKAAAGGCETFPDDDACRDAWSRNPWGDGLSCEHAALSHVDGDDPGCRSYHPLPNIAEDVVPLWPVESHLAGASPYGALNMIGNVWEWVEGTVEPEPGVSLCMNCKDTRGGGVMSSPSAARVTNVNPAARTQRWAQRGARCCWGF